MYQPTGARVPCQVKLRAQRGGDGRRPVGGALRSPRLGRGPEPCSWLERVGDTVLSPPHPLRRPPFSRRARSERPEAVRPQSACLGQPGGGWLGVRSTTTRRFHLDPVAGERRAQTCGERVWMTGGIPASWPSVPTPPDGRSALRPWPIVAQRASYAVGPVSAPAAWPAGGPRAPARPPWRVRIQQSPPEGATAALCTSFVG